MKYTVIRRIDSLGRIVIPKEIRNKLKIKENETMEINIENETIVLKKYTILNDFEKNIQSFGNVLYELTNKSVLITSREKIIYTTNETFQNKELSENLIDYLINRKIIDERINLEIIKNININSYFYGLPIIFNSDVIGLIVIYSENIDNNDKQIVNIINKIISSSLN